MASSTSIQRDVPGASSIFSWGLSSGEFVHASCHKTSAICAGSSSFAFCGNRHTKPSQATPRLSPLSSRLHGVLRDGVTPHAVESAQLQPRQGQSGPSSYVIRPKAHRHVCFRAMKLTQLTPLHCLSSVATLLRGRLPGAMRLLPLQAPG